MKTKFILLFIVIFGINTLSLADSPLTSTDFAVAYAHEPIVQQASQTKGCINKELMAYLMNEQNPVAVKMAVINQLGWNVDGKFNSPLFLEYILQQKKYKSEADFMKRGKQQELLCMAYLLAMDDYFDISHALEYVSIIEKQGSTSYTVKLICAIISVQRIPVEDWCNRYLLPNAVRTDKSLVVDMNEEASRLIFEYMDIYADDCEGHSGGDEGTDEFYEPEGTPLSSVFFAPAYMNEEIVVKASESNNVLTEELLIYLLDKKQPLAVKMAVINQLGSAPSGSGDAGWFLENILIQENYKNETDFLARGKVGELLCMAYLSAMGDYVDVAPAMVYVLKIEEKGSTSYTVRLICALIRAQAQMEHSLCETYLVMDALRNENELVFDMKPEAADLVFEYMDGYQYYCEMALDEGYDKMEAINQMLNELNTPLTSTIFSEIYKKEPVIAKIAKSNGLITDKIIDFLLDEKQTVVAKMAVIGALDFVGENQNTANFLSYLFSKRKYKDEADFLARGKTEELLCFAYLDALNNLHDVSNALRYTETILNREPDSYTVQLVCALIQSQQMFLDPNEWCNVYLIPDEVRKNTALKMDMAPQAAEYVFTYIDQYRSDCNFSSDEDR